MSKQKNRRIGLGMAPRGSVVVAHKVSVPELSTESAHEEVAEEVKTEVVLGDQNAPPLELRGVQNLDSEQVEAAGDTAGDTGGDTIVAQNEEFAPFHASSGFDSKEVTGKIFEPQSYGPVVQVDLETATSLEAMIAASRDEWMAEATTAIFENGKEYTVGIDTAKGEDKSMAAVIRLGEKGAADELIQTLGLTSLGELPNGEYRATVRIAEWCVEGVKGQAEADGISVEDWLTQRMTEYLEQWWAAPAAR